MNRLTMTDSKQTLPAIATQPAQPLTKSGHIVVMTREEIDQLGDILDNPFLPLTDLQKALFTRGYRLVRV